MSITLEPRLLELWSKIEDWTLLLARNAQIVTIVGVVQWPTLDPNRSDDFYDRKVELLGPADKA